MEAIKSLEAVEEVNEWLQRNIVVDQNMGNLVVKPYNYDEGEQKLFWRFNPKSRTHCGRPTIVSNCDNPLKIEYPTTKFKDFDVGMTKTNCNNKVDKSTLIQHRETDKFPLSAFGLLIIYIEDGQYAFATGVLIGENKVLTAIQNIWDKTRNKILSKDCVYFYPGFTQNIAPFGVIKVDNCLLPQDYHYKKVNKNGLEENFVVLLLSEAIGKKTGYLGLEITQEIKLKSKQAFSLEYSLIPYVAETDSFQQQSTCSMFFQNNSEIKYAFKECSPSDELTNYKNSNHNAQSGGIIYYYNDKSDQYYVIGLCWSNEKEIGSNCEIMPITKARFDYIYEWQGMVKENSIKSFKNNCVKEEKEEIEELKLLTIDLSFKELNNEKMEILSTAQLSKLGKLILSECNVNSKTANTIGLNKTWVNLEHLDLRSNNIEDESAAQLGTNNSWKKLKKLVLDSNKIRNIGAIALGRNVMWSELEVLVLSNNQIGCQGVAMIAANRSWKNLKKLILSENIICSKGATAIGKSVIWTNLEELNLNGNKIEDEGAIIIGKNTVWKNLKKLGLSDNIIGDECAIAIAKNKSWSDLSFLDLRSNQVANKGAAALARNSIWSCLQVLALSANSITHEGGVAICRNNSWPSLEGLYMGYNLIKSKSVSELAKSVAWKNLIKLELSTSEIDNEGAIKIGSNQTWVVLEELLLSNNSIGDEGAIAIARNNSWKCLRILDLATNVISDKGAIEIGKNISWIDLEQLRLSGNRIRYKGAVSIANNSFWENIETVYLGRNQKLTLEQKNVLKYCTLLCTAVNTRI